MKFKLLLLLLVVLVVVATTAATGTSVHSPPTLTEHELMPQHDQNAIVQFNYYILALTWPNSYCKIQQSNPDPRTRTCLHNDDQNLPQFFTIHGLWPTLSSGYSVQPSSCTPSKFKISNLDQQVLDRAEQYWPDVKKSTHGTTPQGESAGFWEYEWDSHGICSNLDQTDFMNLTLTIYQRIDQTIIQAMNNIHWSSKKTVDTVAFEKQLVRLIKSKPRIVCGNLGLLKKPQDQYLREIQFRVDKSAPYNFIPAGNSNCDTSKLVYVR